MHSIFYIKQLFLLMKSDLKVDYKNKIERVLNAPQSGIKYHNKVHSAWGVLSPGVTCCVGTSLHIYTENIQPCPRTLSDVWLTCGPQLLSNRGKEQKSVFSFSNYCLFRSFEALGLSVQSLCFSILCKVQHQNWLRWFLMIEKTWITFTTF